jgi:hypothetical protein
MLKSLTREIALSMQARNGASLAVLIWVAVMALALFTAFVFLCVSGYETLSLRYDPVIASLAMAGIFVIVALVAAIVSMLIRRRVRERAILARAAKAHAPSWLLDPRILGTAVEAGRAIGWQRIVPVALVAIMAAQWARESRSHDRQNF